MNFRSSALAWELRRTAAWKRYRGRATFDQELAFYRALIPEGPGCILDVGASHGDKAELFRHFAPVVAIEPDPTAADALRRRFRWRNVSVCQFAVADKAGVIPFYSFQDGSANNSASPEWVECITTPSKNPWGIQLEKPRVTQVEARPLADFLRDHWPVKYLKVDAEGFEDKVLATLDRPVPLISIELIFEHAREVFAFCLSRIASLGSYEFNVAISEPPLRCELPWLSNEAVAKAVAENGWLYIELYARLRKA